MRGVQLVEFSLDDYRNEAFHNEVLARINSYDDLRANWFEVKHGGNFVLDRRKDKLRKAYPDGAIVTGHGLELGFGLGTSTQVLFDWYPDVTLDLIDFNENNLKIGHILKKQYPKRVRELFIGNTNSIPVPDNCYDFVNSSSFFEHLTEEDYRSTLKELYRTLKPGGRVYVYVDQIAENQHIRIVSPEQTCKEMQVVGFNAINNFLYVRP